METDQKYGATGTITDHLDMDRPLGAVVGESVLMGMTPDQLIRAKALEAAVAFVCAMPVEDVLKSKVGEPVLWHTCAEFERYIREGK